MAKFKDNLRKYREQAGYTAKEFASKMEIPYSTYASYENNQEKIPRLDKLIKIADLLNVSLDILLGRTQENKDKQIKKIIINHLWYGYLRRE